MLTLAVTVGTFVSQVVIGVGAVLVAQAAAIDNAGQIVGGSIILGVGVVALRMVLTAARHERESAAIIAQAHMDQIAELERALVHARADLEAERSLRISLEHAGIAQRRHPPDEVGGTPV